ncbi:MAG: hypothetical protein HZA48_04180 [Planctomycetes bacterium]|nr:hypothetical protein [Planctomycetota bacterium]
MKISRTVLPVIAVIALGMLFCGRIFAQDLLTGAESANFFMIVLTILRKLWLLGAMFLLMLILSLIFLLANLVTVRMSYLCPMGDYLRLKKMFQDGALDKAQQLVDKRYNFQSYVIKAAMKAGDVYHFFVDETMDKEIVKCKNRPSVLLFSGVFSVIFAVGAIAFKMVYYFYLTHMHIVTGEAVMKLRNETVFLCLAMGLGAAVIAFITIPFYVILKSKAKKITVDAKYKTTELLELLDKHYTQAQSQIITEKMGDEPSVQESGTEQPAESEETDTAQQEQQSEQEPPSNPPADPGQQDAPQQ